MFGKKPPIRHGRLLQEPANDNEKCRRCQADCCHGFPSVELTAEEYSSLSQLGARRLEFTLNGHFYLIIENGCEFLEENRCRIYNHRPIICQRFTCMDD